MPQFPLILVCHHFSSSFFLFSVEALSVAHAIHVRFSSFWPSSRPLTGGWSVTKFGDGRFTTASARADDATSEFARAKIHHTNMHQNINKRVWVNIVRWLMLFSNLLWHFIFCLQPKKTSGGLSLVRSFCSLRVLCKVRGATSWVVCRDKLLLQSVHSFRVGHRRTQLISRKKALLLSFWRNAFPH